MKIHPTLLLINTYRPTKEEQENIDFQVSHKVEQLGHGVYVQQAFFGFLHAPSLRDALNINIVSLPTSEVDNLPAGLGRISLKFTRAPPQAWQKSRGCSMQNSFFSTPTCTGAKHVAPPIDFVEPIFYDKILHHIPDLESPCSTPRTNPWSPDYFLGDIYLFSLCIYPSLLGS